jgi:hypothetical protein
MKQFLNNQSGIFWVIFVGVTTIMIATVTWLIAMLVTNQFIDIYTAQGISQTAIDLGETMRTEGAFVVVIVDIGMVVWMTVSAFRKESQEDVMF